jgi:hypothetical protein
MDETFVRARVTCAHIQTLPMCGYVCWLEVPVDCRISEPKPQAWMTITLMMLLLSQAQRVLQAIKSSRTQYTETRISCENVFGLRKLHAKCFRGE